MLAKIAGVLGNHDVSLREVLQRGQQNEAANLILLTHTTNEKSINAAVKELKDLSDAVITVDAIIRVE